MIRIAVVAAAVALATTSSLAQEPLYKPSNPAANTYSAIYLINLCGLARLGDRERLTYLDGWSAKYEKVRFSSKAARLEAAMANPQMRANLCRAAQAQNTDATRAKWDENIELARIYERKLAAGER